MGGLDPYLLAACDDHSSGEFGGGSSLSGSKDQLLSVEQ